MTPHADLVCKGSWVLGTACGRCARCRETALDGAKALRDLVRFSRAESRPAAAVVAESVVMECAVTISRIQGRIDAVIEREGSERAAVTSAGFGIGISFARQIVRALHNAALEIDPAYAAEVLDKPAKTEVAGE